MFGLHPPDDPFLINTVLFGLPIQLRWYGVFIVGGAILAAYLAAGRARRRGFDPDDIWNQLMIGMLISIAFARAYYVFFEWERFANKPLLYIINPQNGGLAIHGALIGAVLSAIIYTRWRKLPFWQWGDITVPTILVAQAIGRLGNFFNQEAYGRAITGNVPPFGVIIDNQAQRLPPYDDIQTYPLATTYFHATFLYELTWNLLGFGLLLWLERRLRGWRRAGDMVFFYAIWYGIGRFWVESFRVDSLCTNGVGGSCADSLRAAQIASVALIAVGLIGLAVNHFVLKRPLAIEAETATVRAVVAEPVLPDEPPAEDAHEPFPAHEGGTG